MIAKVLDSCAIALKYRKGVNLPIGASPEERVKKRDLYTYAVSIAALLKPVGSALYLQKPSLYDWRGRHLCDWNPILEEISRNPKARFIRAGLPEITAGRHRPMESLLYSARILPRDGLLWLRSDDEVYGQFLDALSDAPRGPIHELVRKAYRASVDQKTMVAAGEERQRIRRAGTSSPRQRDNEVAPGTSSPTEPGKVGATKPNSGTVASVKQHPAIKTPDAEAEPVPGGRWGYCGAGSSS